MRVHVSLNKDEVSGKVSSLSTEYKAVYYETSSLDAVLADVATRFPDWRFESLSLRDEEVIKL